MDATSAAAAAVEMDAGAAFAPSVWGDFFVTYVPPPTEVCHAMHSFLSAHLV